MPVPASFSDINVNPVLNSPAGSEPIGNNADDYFRAAFAFIKQVNTGTIVPSAALNMNSQKITSMANGTISSTSKDAMNGSNLQSMFKYGEVKMWWGTATQAAVIAAWGPGWFMADGTNGTPDLRDRFPVAAGLSYAVSAAGGVATQVISAAQLPVHAHAVYDPQHIHGIGDPGHAHAVADSGHAHGVNDPSHVHASIGSGFVVAGGNSSVNNSYNGPNNAQIYNGTAAAATGISIAASGSNIGIYGASTGIYMGYSPTNIAIYNAGSSAAIENRPPFVAITFIFYTGAGA